MRRLWYRSPLAGFLAGVLFGPFVTWKTLPGGDAIPIYQVLAGIVVSVGTAYVVTALPAIYGSLLRRGRRMLLAFVFFPLVITLGAFVGLSASAGLFATG